MATAALTCLGIPWGTVLGVCTFLVLERPSVAALFPTPAEGGAAGGAPVPAPPSGSAGQD